MNSDIQKASFYIAELELDILCDVFFLGTFFIICSKKLVETSCLIC